MFLSPLMHNTAELLRGDTATPEWRDLSAHDLSAWWRDRWVKPRASRDDQWREFFPWQWRLWRGTGDDVELR